MILATLIEGLPNWLSFLFFTLASLLGLLLLARVIHGACPWDSQDYQDAKAQSEWEDRELYLDAKAQSDWEDR